MKYLVCLPKVITLITSLASVASVASVAYGENNLKNQETQNTIGGEEQGERVVNVEMLPFDIPEIGASMNVPTSWSIVTFFDAKAAVEKTNYINQEAKDLALTAAQSIGSQSFKIAKNREPYHGPNYSLAIAWTPTKNTSQEANAPVPQSARSEVSSRLLKNQIIPKIQSMSRDFSIVEDPTPIDASGSGAWMTYNERIIKENKESSIESIITTRLYLLIKDDHFIIISISFPKSDDPKLAAINKDILGEMLKSFQIQNSNS